MDRINYGKLIHELIEDLINGLEKGPCCEECDTPMGEPKQTLHTEDWEYEYYDCPNCGKENVVY